MRNALALRLLPVLFPAVLGGTLPELFQKAKEEFKYGSYAASLKTLEKLEQESAAPGLEAARTALRPGLVFYRGANLAALGRTNAARTEFEEFLAFQPNAQLDPALYPKAVIAAFESARTARQQERPAEGLVLADAYRSFPRPEAHPVERLDGWEEGPVRHLLSPKESRDFSRLADPISRSEFVVNFWKMRDPKPETPENEFREEFDKRVAFADSRFAQDEARGSLTDRGRVFILLGPPTYSGRRRLMTGDDAADPSGLSRYTPSEQHAASQGGGSNAGTQARVEHVTGPATTLQEASASWVEIWHYQRATLPDGVPYQEVVFQFVTKQGYGGNVLQRDPSVLATLEKARQTPRRSS